MMQMFQSVVLYSALLMFICRRSLHDLRTDTQSVSSQSADGETKIRGGVFVYYYYYYVRPRTP